jgi:hypothetical protein
MVMIYECLQYARVFIPGSLVKFLWVRWVVVHLKSASLRKASTLLANVTQSWECIPGTNTLAFYEPL